MDGLVLADEIRNAFDLSGRLTEASENADLARIALSGASLRTTTRIMHALAWLVNHRAYLDGDISEFQLRRYGRLPARPAAVTTEQDALLSDRMRSLVGESERFYDRVERLDRAWRDRFTMEPSALERIRARLEGSLARA